MKVYCKNCRHRRSLFLIVTCGISQKVTTVVLETAEEPEHTKTHTIYSSPGKKNRNNDCKDFKKKYSLIILEKIKSWVK